MSNVTITFNQGFPELLQQDWYVEKTAANIQAATYSPLIKDPTQYKWNWSALPSNLFWRVPGSGVIMLRPNVFRDEFWDNVARDGQGNSGDNGVIITDTDWRYDSLVPNGISIGRPGDIPSQASQRPKGHIRTRRAGTAEKFHAYIVDPIIEALLAQFAPMVTMAQTIEPLRVNEGWCMWVHVPGNFTLSSRDYLVINFGVKYALHLQLNGIANLFVNVNYVQQVNTGQSASLADWQKVAEFVYAPQGGTVHGGRQMQIAVIPWGSKYISFSFSGGNEPQGNQRKNNISLPNANHHLYDCSVEGYYPRFDKLTNQYVKTEAGPITISMQAYLQHYHLIFAKIRYSTALTNIFKTMPEDMPELALYSDPISQGFGFFGQTTGTQGDTPAQLAYQILNHSLGTTWDRTKDQKPILQFELVANSQGCYSPELWGYNIHIPPKIATPSWTPIDVSPKWTMIRLQQHTDYKPARAEIKIWDKTDNWDTMLMEAGHPVKISITHPITKVSYAVFNGYIDRSQPTITPVLSQPGVGQETVPDVQKQFTALDMWVRLDSKMLDSYLFLNGLSMKQVFFDLLNKAGFSNDAINFIDPDGYIESQAFESLQNPDDWMHINPDASVGDVFRMVLKNYWVRPIRLIWVENQWHIYSQVKYTYVPGTPPPIVFVCRDNATMTDTQRWTNHQFRVTGNLEFTQEEIDFNMLIGRCTKELGEGGDSYECVIPGSTAPSKPGDGYDYFAYRSVNDPTYPWFIGRVKTKVVSPPEITLAANMTDLEKITRLYYERFARKYPQVEFVGEWVPGEVPQDTIVWIVGIGKDGKYGSYGAWRIENVDIELHLDTTPDSTWHNQARYTARFVGRADGKISIDLDTKGKPITQQFDMVWPTGDLPV